MNRSDRFIDACRLLKTDCTPVWFMRQAGRYMAEYRALRERHGLMKMFLTPEIAAEVTLQPLKAFALDAAIIFSDILIPLQRMGIDLEYAQGEGPVIHNPVRTRADVDALRVPDPEEDLGFALESIRMVAGELNGRLPLIGFAGAPFTLASYMIEGGGSRSYIQAKELMYGEPETWDELMRKVSDMVASYLVAQFEAGARVVQLFDSWVGCLSPSDYRAYVLPHSARVFRRLKKAGIPSIHFGTGTGDLLTLMREAGGDVIGADWRTPLGEAWKRISPGAGIQGNLDPVTLMAPRPLLEARAKEILDQAAGRPGHIFNLGHGILPPTPVDAVKALADFVHAYRPRKGGDRLPCPS